MGWFSKLFSRRRAPDEGYEREKQAIEASLDAALARVRAGESLSRDELAACAATFSRLYDLLSEHNGTEDNTAFTDEDRVFFYSQALKLTALGHPDHTAWPFMSGVRARITDALWQRLAKDPDPWLYLCAIQPALLSKNLDLALDCFRQTKRDPFVHALATRWAHETAMAYPGYNRPEVVRAFLGASGMETPWNEPAIDVAENLRFILLTSVFPFLSADPRRTLADVRPLAAQRVQLERDWGIGDEASARKKLDWLLHEGHGAVVEGDLEAPATIESAAARRFVERNRDALSRHRILAWDLCRLVAVARSAHAVGYLDEKATWDYLLEAAQLLCEEYRGWDDLAEDYILGVSWFDPEGIPLSSHIAMVRWLKTDPASPWRRVAFPAIATQC